MSPLIARRIAEKLAAARAGRSATECWEWQHTVSSQGYGKHGPRYAHRVAYEAARGPIPEGLQIDHLCRNRKCVNPAHLEAVSARVNTQRGMSPAAVLARENRCIRGHEMTPDNIYAHARPARPRRGDCRACTRALAAGTCPDCGVHYKWLRPHVKSVHQQRGAA